jgi:hypothetical protein
VRVCVFPAFGREAWVVDLGLVVGAEIMFGTRTESSWNSERFASRRRENGVGESSPERTGRMKRGQS